MWVARFVRVGLVRPVARPGIRWVRSRSSVWSGCALGVTGSLVFSWFVHVRPGGRWVRSGSSVCVLVVGVFYWIRRGVPWLLLGSF